MRLHNCPGEVGLAAAALLCHCQVNHVICILMGVVFKETVIQNSDQQICYIDDLLLKNYWIIFESK